MRKSKVLAKTRTGRVARIFCIGSPLGMVPSMAAHFHYDGIWVDAEHRVCSDHFDNLLNKMGGDSIPVQNSAGKACKLGGTL